MHDFIITLNMYSLCRQLSAACREEKGYASQLMDLLRIDKLSALDNKYEAVNFRMSAEQFGQFIYLRAAAGANNGIKELRMERIQSGSTYRFNVFRDLTESVPNELPSASSTAPAQMDNAISVAVDIGMAATGSASASTGGMSHHAAEIDTLRALASKVEDAQIVSICGGIEVDRISALDLVYDEIHKREQAIASMFTSNRQQ